MSTVLQPPQSFSKDLLPYQSNLILPSHPESGRHNTPSFSVTGSVCFVIHPIILHSTRTLCVDFLTPLTTLLHFHSIVLLSHLSSVYYVRTLDETPPNLPYKFIVPRELPNIRRLPLQHKHKIFLLRSFTLPSPFFSSPLSSVLCLKSSLCHHSYTSYVPPQISVNPLSLTLND